MTRLTQIFDKIRVGLFQFDSAVHLQPRAPGLRQLFTPGRIFNLRKKLMLAGVNPDVVGLPVVEPLVVVRSGPKKTLKSKPAIDKELKWSNVRKKLDEMPKLMEEARERRKAAKLEKKKKLPF